LELRDIEYFAVIAEHRHLGRAAETLGLSVPALSKSLRRLEAASGSKLVQRTPKGIELTAEGAALLSHVRALRVSLRDITRQLADLRHGHAGDVHVGAAPGYAEFLLPGACSALQAAGSRTTISIMVGSRDVTIPALLQGELDLVITERTAGDAGLVCEHLYDDEVVVTAAVDHPLARRSRLTLADLVGEQWALPTPRLRDQLFRLFETRGLTAPAVTLLTNSSWLRMRTVASSRLLGLHAVPTSFAFAEARSHLAILPVEDLVWKRAVCAFYRDSTYSSAATQRLVEALKRVAAAGAQRDPRAAVLVELHDAQAPIAETPHQM
jgi:DNA-binding transcriptional LysR family regulator